MHNPKILILLLISGLFSASAEAKLYKWVDDRGVTHYGETIPAEFANKDRSELSKNGRIVNTTDVLTPEEHRAKEAVEAQHKADLQIERDLKLHDSSLLNTYSNVKEIDIAKVRNLQQVDARGQISSKQLIEAVKNLETLKAKAAVQTKAGRPVPAFLKDDIDDAQVTVDKLNKENNAINAERSALEARYDADKARYKLLTGK